MCKEKFFTGVCCKNHQHQKTVSQRLVFLSTFLPYISRKILHWSWGCNKFKGSGVACFSHYLGLSKIIELCGKEETERRLCGMIEKFLEILEMDTLWSDVVFFLLEIFLLQAELEVDASMCVCVYQSLIIKRTVADLFCCMSFLPRRSVLPEQMWFFSWKIDAVCPAPFML